MQPTEGLVLLIRDGFYWMGRLANARLVEVWGPSDTYYTPDEYTAVLESDILVEHYAMEAANGEGPAPEADRGHAFITQDPFVMAW